MYLFINNEFYGIHPKLRNRVKLAASRLISSEYERLYTAVHDPQNGYINVESIMLHTPQQIKTLLDCDLSVCSDNLSSSNCHFSFDEYPTDSQPG